MTFAARFVIIFAGFIVVFTRQKSFGSRPAPAVGSVRRAVFHVLLCNCIFFPRFLFNCDIMQGKGGSFMPYFRYRIDARRLNLDLQQNVWDFIRHNTDIHTADISRPGLFEAYFTESELPLLSNQIFIGCQIRETTQETCM